MNGQFDLHIITQPHSEVYCGYFRRLVFGNSFTFSHIPTALFWCYTSRFPTSDWAPWITITWLTLTQLAGMVPERLAQPKSSYILLILERSVVPIIILIVRTWTFQALPTRIKVIPPTRNHHIPELEVQKMGKKNTFRSNLNYCII